MIEYVRGFSMAGDAKKIELTGYVDKNGHLKLDADVPFKQGDVKVIVFPSTESEVVEDDPSVDEMLRAAEVSGAFDFWNDPEEDIYTIEDGKPAE